MGRFLTERAGFPHIPAVAGALEYRVGRREPMTLGILQAFVANEGDAWRFTLDQLESYYERALALHRTEVPVPEGSLLELIEEDPPPPLLRNGHPSRARPGSWDREPRSCTWHWPTIPRIRTSPRSRLRRSTSAASTSRCVRRPPAI